MGKVDMMPSLIIWLRVLSIVWLILGQLVLLPAVQAQAVPKKLCNNIIYIRAHEQNNYFDFPDSPLKQIVKVTITYCSVNNSTIGDEMPYETMWYSSRQPLGCRRYRDLDIIPLNVIYVYLDASSDPEIAAAANALIRVLFETNLNRNSITAIETSSDCFKSLIVQLGKENFYTLSNLPSFTALAYIYLPLTDEIGDKQMLIYSGNY